MSLRDEAPSVELKEKMGIELVNEVVKKNRLRWQGRLLQKDDGDMVKSSVLYEVNDRGRLRMTCIESGGQEICERAWVE